MKNKKFTGVDDTGRVVSAHPPVANDVMREGPPPLLTCSHRPGGSRALGDARSWIGLALARQHGPRDQREGPRECALPSRSLSRTDRLGYCPSLTSASGLS